MSSAPAAQPTHVSPVQRTPLVVFAGHRWLSHTLFWVGLGLALAACGYLVWAGFHTVGLWADPAYNITLPRNIVLGHGYASDGVMTIGGLDLFDPRISTGPMVLLPIAAAQVLGTSWLGSAQVVMALYYVLFLAAVAVLAKRIWGYQAIPLALFSTFLVNYTATASPILTPLDVLGEYPAATFILLALVFLPRHPWWAGLFLGLAAQAKLVALLALPVIVLYALLAQDTGNWWRRCLWALRAIPLIFLPILGFEILRFVSLGSTGYRQNLQRFWVFFQQEIAHHTISTCIERILQDLTPATWLSAAVLLILFLSPIVCLVLPKSRAVCRRVLTRPQLTLWATSWTGTLLWLSWWTVSHSHDLWIRQAAPGLLSFLTLLTVSSVFALVNISTSVRAGELTPSTPDREIPQRSRQRTLAAASCALFSVIIVASTLVAAGGRLQAVRNIPQLLTISYQQRIATTVIAQNQSDVLEGPWSELPAFAFLAQKRAVLLPTSGYAAPGNLIYMERAQEKTVFYGPKHTPLVELCGKTVYVDRNIRLCLPRSA